MRRIACTRTFRPTEAPRSFRILALDRGSGTHARHRSTKINTPCRIRELLTDLSLTVRGAPINIASVTPPAVTDRLHQNLGTQVSPVRFHRPYLTGNEEAHIAKALASGHFHGDGPYSEAVAAELSHLTASPSVLLTPSCTHALELSGLLLDIEPGDEVIMPSFTFVSTANAYVLRGAKPVFVDVDPVTLNIDPAATASAITPRTKAIVVVHYAGVSCEMDQLLALGNKHGVPVIEDNAHGLGGTWKDRPLGSIGSLAALSFHDTKNFQCGEGGALLINDPSLVHRAEILREKGTNRRAFMRGDIDKYSWVEIGSSYLLSEVLAAMLGAQLSAFEYVQKSRHRIWSRYKTELESWAQSEGIQLPAPHEDSTHAAHLFHILLPSAGKRHDFLDHMKANNVGSAFHYVPLHSTRIAQELGHVGDLPVTDSVASRLARLPLYPDLTNGEVDRVLEVVTSFTS
ncbi:MAG: dTDP-4-amino-4,6-dideoxygalactose transaminase [Microthrixaceae bacterium]